MIKDRFKYASALRVPSLLGMKINLPIKLNRNLFIAKLTGSSMEPTIKTGSWCVFSLKKEGCRDGKIVLAESHHINDPESQEAYTIKRYFSGRRYLRDGQWLHKKVILSPDNKDFEDIVLNDVSEDDFSVIAEFVGVVSAGRWKIGTDPI